LELKDLAERKVALNAMAREGEDALVAKLLAAGVDAEQAADLLKSVANDDTQPQYIRDLARLKMASTDGAGSVEEAAAILVELSEPGGLYRNVATNFWRRWSCSAAIQKLLWRFCKPISKMPMQVRSKSSAWRN
jgi:hypothetical protein